MKKYTIIILGIMFFTVGTLVNLVVAAERQKVYEMGESSQTVSFRMTIEEIAAEDTEKERIATIRETKTQKSKQRRKIFELAESGETIEFHVKGVDIMTGGVAKTGTSVEAVEVIITQ